MTFEELKQETIRLCQFDADEPTTNEVGKYVNMAIQAASRFTRYLIGIKSKSVPQGNNIVEMGNDVIDIEQVWWNNTLLEPETTPWTQSPNLQGTPKRYQSSGSRLILFPTPNQSGTVYVRAVLLHEPLTINSQIPNLPTDMHLSLAWYAAGIWLMGYSVHSEQTQRAQNLIQNALNYWRNVSIQSQVRGIETRRDRIQLLPEGGGSSS